MADVERPHSPFRVRPDVGAIGIVGEHQQHLSSRELSEQIKQLEEEGSKLMTATHSLSGEYHFVITCRPTYIIQNDTYIIENNTYI